MAWQAGRGRAATGFIGEADARVIQREALRGFDTAPTPRLTPPSPQDEIPLSRRKGIFVVPGLINETITLGFILDSGAADVQIPVDVVMTLARAGTISDSDFLGTQTYTMADGTTLGGPIHAPRAAPWNPHRSERAREHRATQGRALVGTELPVTVRNMGDRQRAKSADFAEPQRGSLNLRGAQR
jgi:hypothetical protein